MFLPIQCLLAETHMAEVSLQYREDVAANGMSDWWYLLIPVAAVAIAYVIYKVFDRPPPIVNTPQGMLHELCKAHTLNGPGRRLLERITEEAELDHPALVFINASTFEQAVAKASRCASFSRRDKAVLSTLRRRLFAA